MISKKLHFKLTFILFFLLQLLIFPATAQESQKEDIIPLVKLSYPKDVSEMTKKVNSVSIIKNYTPIKKNGSQKWRIAYLEGGPYIEYRKYFVAIIKGLMEIGWVKKTPIPKFKEEELIVETEDIPSTQLWDWLATKLESDYLEFVKNAHYSAEWDDELREKIKKQVITRLNKTKDVDLIIAAGTRAGKDLANNEHNVPVVVISTSAPIESGIIKSAEDSGYDHVLAHLDPDQWKRQLDLFHSTVKFKKLGVAYENTKDGRSYAALASVEKAAKDKNFEIVHCHAPSDSVDQKVAYTKLLDCHQKLAKKVDAFFITEHGGLGGDLKKLIAPFLDNKIPTLSQKGYDHVRQGILLGIGSTDYDNVGIYFAQVIQRILNGEKPRDISQIFRLPTVIAVNLATANKLGFKPSSDILGASDKIFTEIE